MIYKSLMLSMVFILAFGINTGAAKDEPYKCICNCTELVSKSVDAVLEISNCDFYGQWKAPEDLIDQLENLQNWCTNSRKPVKSKSPDLIDDMLETIYLTIMGESYEVNGKTEVISEPAPDCAIEALLNLQNLLLYGCPTQVIE